MMPGHDGEELPTGWVMVSWNVTCSVDAYRSTEYIDSTRRSTRYVRLCG